MSPIISRIRKSLFAADTLFALGCGRLFECKPPVMFDSLKKLAALPLETAVYCGHEYTQSNARFALTVDPTNSALKERAAEIDRLRADGKPTLPTTIGARAGDQPVPALARSGDPQAISAWKTPAMPRSSPRSASARTSSDADARRRPRSSRRSA